MSSLIGKITAAVGAVHNENSLALANINADFTLFKYEAPKEFNGLGAALSQQRKTNAEGGTLHRTARKLGALFEGRLPATPALFRAYGTRVSEISQRPGVKPRASDQDGIFASYLGIDAGSIWAAVTSGDEAIAVHMLACMLARIFTGPEATSVWVELVEKQKQQIHQDHSEAMYAHKLNASMVAAEQELSRVDLGNWDSSARAWLQSADQAMERQHKQLMLILECVNLPINNEPAVYDSVMKAWKVALQAMDNLVQGIPQQVQEGAALLGISSWHLYPDKVVLGGKAVDVRQGDELFGGTAILTIGLEIVRQSSSVSWSLPLACLRYYGQPVPTYGSLGPDNSRITLDQFGFVVLGCIFSKWQEFGKTLQGATTWLHDIAQLIQPSLRRILSHKESNSHWLNYLEHTAQNLLGCTDVNMNFANQLLALGKRRSEFFYMSNIPVQPLFGLSDMATLLSLMVSSETRVAFLRKVATQLNLIDEKYIIRYRPSDDSINNYHHFEYATVRPHTHSAKRTYYGLMKEGSSDSTAHIRWLSFNPKQTNDCSCNAMHAGVSRFQKGCECEHNPWRFKCALISCTDVGKCQSLQHTPFWQRYEALQLTKESCLSVLDEELKAEDDAIQHGVHLRFAQGMSFEDTFQTLKQQGVKHRRSIRTTSVKLQFVAGDFSSAAIFIPKANPPNSSPVLNPTLRPQHLEGVLVPEVLSVEAVSRFILAGRFGQFESKSLMCCAAVADVYKLMPDATISTKVLGQPINLGHWAALARGRNILSLTRPQTFACIAMFDSGTCDLDPGTLQDVFSMSSGNSIYVSGAVLCDPHEETQPKEIRRVTGNFGRAGISLLMGPPYPEIREPEIENWKQINHYPFQGVQEDCFKETTVHLSFTGYDLPLMTQRNDRHIDRPANLVETRVSVHDRGKWVGDLDLCKSPRVPEAPSNYDLLRLMCEGHSSALRHNECQKRPKSSFEEVLHITDRLNGISIDNWDELLEAPPTGTVFVRAHKNWLARLALTRVCIQLGFKVIILPDEVCWPCCAYALLDRTDHEQRIALVY